MSIGTFMLIKNEARWIGAHLASFLPVVDQMVFYDGKSEDGTLEILERFQKHHPQGWKIGILFKRDPADLRDTYTQYFDSALHDLDTDLAWFVHPDMVILKHGDLSKLKDSIAGSVNMRSYGGEPGGQLYEIVSGRADRWKNIYRLRNPDLGAHYHGWYGAANEDVYFSEITGSEHRYYGPDFGLYPYPVDDSGFELAHFSDVRPLERRLDRMEKCLINQGHAPEAVKELASKHPRVTLKDSGGFRFIPAEYPEVYTTWEQSILAGVK